MKESRRIDAHQHFWRYNPDDYTWMTDEMSVLKSDFMPDQLAGLVESYGIAGTIVVQARHSERENEFLMDICRNNSFVAGIVGWVDLARPSERTIESLAAEPCCKGIRYILEGKTDLMRNPQILSGLSRLRDVGLTFDLYVQPNELPAVATMIGAVPGLTVAINHLGLPGFTPERFELWHSGMKKLAEIDTVYCKISGMVTGAGPEWKTTDYAAWLDPLFELFGADRLMFGSDWPTCSLVGAEYRDIWGIVDTYLGSLSRSERNAVGGGTAGRCYRLDPP